MNTTLINQTVTSNVPLTIVNYFQELPRGVMSGNAGAIIIALILFFVSLIIINALSSLLLSFLKRTILFFIIILVIYDLFPKYVQVINTQGWTFSVIVLGILGFAACGFGFYISLRSFVTSAKNHIVNFADKVHKKHTPTSTPVRDELLRKWEIKEAKKQTESIKEGFSKESITNDKSLLAVLVYLVVAQFGVFSSPTLSAPNVNVGVMFFLIFIVGIMAFTNSSYKNLKTAMLYFGVTFAVGLFLSFALGILWGKSTLAQLMSPEFFTSDSLVAMITGIGVSLFAGSKG